MVQLNVYTVHVVPARIMPILESCVLVRIMQLCNLCDFRVRFISLQWYLFAGIRASENT